MPDESLANVRIAVTGATGFVGSAFVRHAVAEGARVTALDRAGSDHWRLTTVAGRYARVTAPLARLAAGAAAGTAADTAGDTGGTCDVVVHCAAAGVNQRFDDVGTLVDTNVTGTLHALQYALAAGARRFVLLGSSGEYGPGVRIDEDAPLRPTSEYGASRAAATLLARAFGARRGLDVVVVRPFAVYGPYEAAYRLVPHCTLRGLRGEPIRISSGVQTRDYVHVADVADGIGRACVVESARGGTFNLCTGTDVAVRDAAALVARLSGGRSTVEAGALAPIAGEMWRTSGAPDRAAATLGWTPTRSLEEGLRETIEWFRAVGTALPAYRDDG